MTNYSANPSEPSTLVELLHWRALHQPDQRAYTFLVDGEMEQVHLTYGELDRRARTIGAWLQKLGVVGERALVLYPPGLEYIAALFGCLYAGVVAVPAYPPRLNQSAFRLKAIVADAQAGVALTTPAILSSVKRLFAQDSDWGSLQWLTSNEIADDAEGSWQEPVISRNTLAFLQYTSGSTTAPKGVMLTYGNLLHNLALIELTASSRGVSWLPPYHDMGLIGGVLQPLYGGFPITLLSPFAFLQRPVRWLEAISRTSATISGGPNFAYDLCVRRITPEQRMSLDLSSWEVAFSGAEPIRHETLEQFAATFESCSFRREAFYPCYGLAESTLIVSGGEKAAQPIVRAFHAAALEHKRVVLASPEDDRTRTLVGCGQALLDQQVIVVDPETLTRCSPDQVGEVWVSGPSVAQGYWNRFEETEHTFQAYLSSTGEGPFLRTGDLGFLHDGELFITGRLKDLIIVRGRNHYPQDIEYTVERSHPALRRGCGAAFAVEVANEERLVVVQELEHRQHPEIDEVVGNIRQAVAEEHEIQVYAVSLIKPGSIPKTTSGKVQRFACRAGFLAGSLDVLKEWHQTMIVEGETLPSVSENSLQSAEAIEAWLAAQLAAKLGVETWTLDLDQPISRYGVDSLVAVELTHSIEANLGVIVPMESLLQGYSVAELSAQLLELLRAPSSTPSAILAPRNAVSEYPLSFAQQRLWFLNQLAPASTAYNIPVSVRLSGPLNVEALEQSLNEVVRRHEALRTTFAVVEGYPVQVVAPALAVALPVVDLRVLSQIDRQAEAQRVASEEAELLFDLAQGPLLRAKLHRLDEEEYVLLLTMHHIVSDGWSMGVLNRELTVLYEAYSAGKPSPLPRLPIQYADFACWQREWLQGEALEIQLAYWKQQLDGAPAVMELPTDQPRPPVQTFRGARQSLILPERLAEALKLLSQEEDATLFMTLLAAFKVLLHRYTGQDDILVGSPIAGRNRAELGRLIGFFVNTLVLRTDLSGNPTFRELLGRVRETTLEAYAHQDLPFERLVEELQPERHLSHSPLFQVMFNMLSFAGLQVELPGLRAEILSSPEPGSKFDLTLYVGEQNRQVWLELVYNADLFGRARMAEMLQQFKQLLSQVVAAPGEGIACFSLVTPTAEVLLPNPAQPLRSEWEGDIQARFSQHANRVPERPAVVGKREAWTYRELDVSTNQLANYLRANGIQPQDTVAIYGHHSASLVWALLGVLKAGAAFLILDPAYPASRLIDCLKMAGPAGWLQIEAAGGLPHALEQFVSTLPCRLGLPEKATAAERDLLMGYSIENPQVAVGPDDLAYVAFTSGSSGRPKGILGTHRPLSHFLQWHSQKFGLTESDRFSVLSGLSHDPLLREIFTPLWLGATLCIPESEDRGIPDRLAEWMKREEISIAHLTPAMGQLLTESFAAVALTRVRYAFFAGDVLTKRDVYAFRKVASMATCVNFYGTTETPQAMGYFIVPDRGDIASDDGLVTSKESLPLGRGIKDVQLLVLNSHQLLAGIGELGEVCVRTPYLTRGYVANDSLTRERFTINPYTGTAEDRVYMTGDLGRYSPDGTLEFVGRSDRQVNIRGFRIELEEIEATLGQHPWVQETVVMAREDLPGDKCLVAYVVLVPGGTPTHSELRSFLQEKLPDYMIPSTFLLLESLPLTPNGKVDRRALPQPNQERPELHNAFVTARTPAEEVLAGFWTQVLGVEQVGVYDNFFELGGNSLSTIKVHNALCRHFGIEIPLVKLFQFPTIHALAEYLQGTQTEELHHLERSRAIAARRRQRLSGAIGKSRQ